MYAEIIGRYLSRDAQESMETSIPDTPWATPDVLDMPGLMAAFQAFWRENSGADRHIPQYWRSTTSPPKTSFGPTQQLHLIPD